MGGNTIYLTRGELNKSKRARQDGAILGLTPSRDTPASRSLEAAVVSHRSIADSSPSPQGCGMGQNSLSRTISASLAFLLRRGWSFSWLQDDLSFGETWLSCCLPWSLAKVQLSQGNYVLPLHSSVLGFLFLTQTPLLPSASRFPFLSEGDHPRPALLREPLHFLETWPTPKLHASPPAFSSCPSITTVRQPLPMAAADLPRAPGWGALLAKITQVQKGVPQSHCHSPRAISTSLELPLPWSVLFLQCPQSLV